jgi:hypothetical protein
MSLTLDVTLVNSMNDPEGVMLHSQHTTELRGGNAAFTAYNRCTYLHTFMCVHTHHVRTVGSTISCAQQVRAH